MAVLSSPTNFPASSTIVFDKEVYDNSDNYNNQNGIYTVNKTGYYYVSSAVQSTTGRPMIRVEVDGVVRSRGGSDGDTGISDYYATVGTVLRLTEGEEVKVISEGNMDAHGMDVSQGYATWFNIAFLYPE